MNPSSASERVGLRIFLVEDHVDTSKAMKRYLERKGYYVETASDVTSALTAIPQANCDVLLSDVGLPDGDGWHLLGQLKVRPPYAIALSGYGTLADKLRSKEAGFRHHLVKPFDLAHLDRLLEEAAREKSLG